MSRTPRSAQIPLFGRLGTCCEKSELTAIETVVDLVYLRILGPVLLFVTKEILADGTSDAVRPHHQVGGLVWRPVCEPNNGLSCSLCEYSKIRFCKLQCPWGETPVGS